MVFKRVLMPMLVLSIVLAMGTMAFAQTPSVNCTIASAAAQSSVLGGLPSLPGPTARATATGHTEPVAAGPDATSLTVAGGQPSGTPGTRTPGGGTIRVTCTNISGSAVGPGLSGAGFLPTTLAVGQISFGVQITNGTGFPAGAPIRLANLSGALAGNVTFPAGADPVSRTAGTVTFQISNGAAGTSFAAGQSGSFDLSGVLVSLNGSGKTSVDASLFIGGGTGYQAASPNSANVIASVLPGLKDPTVAASIPSTVAGVGTAILSGGPATYNLLGIGVKSNFTLRIEENYQDMFKSVNQFNGGGGGVFPLSGSSNTEVQLQFSGIPAGITLGGCTAVLTDQSNNLTTGSPALSSTSLTASTPTATVNFSADVSLTTVDVLWITCTTITSDPTVITTLPSTPITVQASLAPGGAALSTTGGLLSAITTGQIPRYQLSLQPATGLVVVSFPPGAVSLLIPFATVGGGYNTGIAVSNTTIDTLGASAASSVTPQSGTLTFTLLDNTGGLKTYTTGATSPGSGLTAGVLNAGKTYAVNLSDILSAAGLPATFSGYLYVTTNFTNAHGAAYIYNGAGFTSSTPVLVMGVNRATPEGLNN